MSGGGKGRRIDVGSVELAALHFVHRDPLVEYELLLL